MPEAPYEMRGDTKALGGPRKGREAKERGERIEDLPFAGISVCLYGDFKSPSRSELQGLVELGGGKILLLHLKDFADWRSCLHYAAGRPYAGPCSVRITRTVCHATLCAVLRRAQGG